MNDDISGIKRQDYIQWGRIFVFSILVFLPITGPSKMKEYFCNSKYQDGGSPKQIVLKRILADHTAWIRSGAKENDTRRANLCFADLSNRNLSGIDLRKANFIATNLTNATLSGADLRGANLGAADLTWAYLRKTKIDCKTKIDEKWRMVWSILNTNNVGRNLSGLDLSYSNLNNANLSYTNLQGADLNYTSLRNVDLSEANLRGSDLSQADLTGANLSGTDLRESNLRGVDFHFSSINNKTNLDEKWRTVWLIINESYEQRDLSGIDLHDANLSFANLEKANLSETDLGDADLFKADLREANLRGSNLSGASLIKASLVSTNLSGADLSGANLSEAHIIEANLIETNLKNAKLIKTMIWGTDLHKAYLYNANLSYSDLSNANLSESIMSGTMLKEAKLIDTNLSNADFTNVNLASARYEPSTSPNKAFLSGIQNLDTVIFSEEKQSGLVLLRKSLKEAGLRELERKATYSIEKGKTNHAPSWIVRFTRRLFFEYTAGYGLYPERCLIILFVLIPGFALIYFLYVYRNEPAQDGCLAKRKDGIFKIWSDERIRQDFGSAKPESLSAGFVGSLGYALHFSVLSAFQIGWREINVGNWIARIQRQEYTLRSTGWVRTFSGIQSLISIYLLAYWVLTQFGRPFD